MGLESLGFLCHHAPGFALRGSQVKVLTEPMDFYSELCRRASTAQRRITLASLYLGTGEKERRLVEAVKRSLTDSFGKVKVNVLLDFCRGTRDVNGESSCTMLRPITDEFGGSCRVAMYHTPTLRGIWKKVLSQRWNETIGLQHCKVYIFDDSLIISGANLSNDYFTNRQDRYVLVEDCPRLADFFDELVQNIQDFSFQMKDGKFELDPGWSEHPYEGSFSGFVDSANAKVNEFLKRQQKDNTLGFSGGTFQSTEKSHPPDCDTWIFPSVQMGPMNVTQDSQLTTMFLESGEPSSVFKFGTGYFNITAEYQHVVLHKSRSDFDILMAHPRANGFYQARGPAGGIPPAYTLIAHKFFDLIVKNEDLKRVRIHEYERQGWTFHGKGLWYYPPHESLPSATLVGSPNFGYRSVEKDLEAQITIVTKNADLRKNLHEEQQRMFECTTQVTKDTFDEPDRKIPQWVKAVVGVARQYF